MIAQGGLSETPPLGHDDGMRRCTALALACLLFVVGCSNSTTPDSDSGVDGAITMDGGMEAGMDAALPPPVCTDDPDVGSAIFVVESIAIPRTTDSEGVGGFDVDGLNSTDANVEGCGKVDFPDGVDNAFVYVAERLNQVLPLLDEDIDLYAEVAAMIENGAIAIDVELQHWNETVNDDAVGVLITITANGTPQQALGCGRMIDGVLEGSFPMPVPLAIGLGGLAVSLELKSPRVRLVLSEDGQTLDAAASYVGGYILWDDGTPTNLPGELRAQILSLLAIVPPELQGFAQVYLDGIGEEVDTEGHPSLAACTIVEGDYSADSISVGFRLSGSRAPISQP